MPMRQKLANFLSLFTSVGTLLCCALPALLVAIGAGAAVASLVSTVPWLVRLSRYKEWLFAVAGLLIGLNFFLVYRPDGKIACATGAGKACEQASRWNKVVLWISASIFAVGLFMAYAALPIRQWLEE